MRSFSALLVTLLLVACGTPNTAVRSPSELQSPLAAPSAVAPQPSQAIPIGARIAPVGATATIDDGAWLIADRLSAPTYTTDTTAALVEGLARSGIGVFADATSPSPEQPTAVAASPFKLLDFQAHALAVGIWTESGYTGAELDSVVGIPAGDSSTPTTSDILASYVAAVETPGASLSRALMAGQDLLSPTTLRFPAAVMVLFASDLATGGDGSALTHGTNALLAVSRTAADAVNGQVIPLALVIGTVCSQATNWVNSMIASLFDALKLATPDNYPGKIAVEVWNWLVDRAHSFVQGLINSVSNAVLGTIRSIAATISTVAESIASLVPYGLRVSAAGDTGGATFMLGPDPLNGRFTANVTSGDLPDWPPVLSDCAAKADVALPDFHAKNVPLTWGRLEAPVDPLLTPDAANRTEDATDANGQANWVFTTSPDPGDRSEAQENQVDAMPVTVHRPEVEAARKHLNDALLGSIPGLLQPYVSALLAPYINGVQARLNALLDARGRGTAILVFHDKPKPTPTPPVTPQPTATGPCASSPVQPGSYTGTANNVSSDTIDQGTFGGIIDHTTGSGPVALTIGADGTAIGTWSMRSMDVFEETSSANGVELKDHRESTTDYAGSFFGTACNLELTFNSVTVVSCVDSLKGDCSGTQVPTGKSPAPGGLGPPSSTGPGQATWTFHYSSNGDSVVTDDLTIAVSASP